MLAQEHCRISPRHFLAECHKKVTLLSCIFQCNQRECHCIAQLCRCAVKNLLNQLANCKCSDVVEFIILPLVSLKVAVKLSSNISVGQVKGTVDDIVTTITQTLNVCLLFRHCRIKTEEPACLCLLCPCDWVCKWVRCLPILTATCQSELTPLVLVDNSLCCICLLYTSDAADE